MRYIWPSQFTEKWQVHVSHTLTGIGAGVITIWIAAPIHMCTLGNLHANSTCFLSSHAARQDGSDIAVPYIMQKQDDGNEIPVFLNHTGSTSSNNKTYGRRRKRGATAYRHLLWPNGTIIYTIGAEYTGNSYLRTKWHLKQGSNSHVKLWKIAYPMYLWMFMA